ncbi:MAG: DUF4190 domain-containing protein [Bacteroidota bacterium]
MKTFYALFLFVFLFGASSCSIQKRVHRPGFHIEWLSHKNPKQVKAHARIAHKNTTIKKTDSVAVPKPEMASASVQEVYTPQSSIIDEQAKTEPCDVMILRSGEEVSAKVLEVNSASIRYKKCENLNGPDYFIEKSDVFMIKYANGIKEIIEEPKPGENQNNVRPPDYRRPPHVDTRTVPGIAITAFVLSLASVFLSFVGIFTLIAGFVLGFAALKQINENPERYKGRGFAYTAIIFSGTFLLLFLLFLVIVLVLIGSGNGIW